MSIGTKKQEYFKIYLEGFISSRISGPDFSTIMINQFPGIRYGWMKSVTEVHVKDCGSSPYYKTILIWLGEDNKDSFIISDQCYSALRWAENEYGTEWIQVKPIRF